jgi:hydrogenase/urease accessory protein HupE
MGELIEISIISSIAIFFASVIPIYLSFHLKGNLRKLTILIGIFGIVHGIYHATEVFGYEEFADNILEPISVLVLVIFGFWYLRIRSIRRASI